MVLSLTAAFLSAIMLVSMVLALGVALREYLRLRHANQMRFEKVDATLLKTPDAEAVSRIQLDLALEAIARLKESDHAADLVEMERAMAALQLYRASTLAATKASPTSAPVPTVNPTTPTILIDSPNNH